MMSRRGEGKSDYSKASRDGDAIEKDRKQIKIEIRIRSNP
jgi:hypothetical protein